MNDPLASHFAVANRDAAVRDNVHLAGSGAAATGLARILTKMEKRMSVTVSLNDEDVAYLLTLLRNATRPMTTQQLIDALRHHADPDAGSVQPDAATTS